jgi:hypothetical protein
MIEKDERTMWSIPSRPHFSDYYKCQCVVLLDPKKTESSVLQIHVSHPLSFKYMSHKDKQGHMTLINTLQL